MNTIRGWTRMTPALAVMAGLVACADAPNAPAAAVPSAAVVAAFEAMSRDAAVAGAVDARDDLRWLASALREGVQPSHVEIWTYGKMEDYDAVVRAIEAPALNAVPRREPGHLMLAWQRHGSPLINHVLRLWSPGDNGRIVPHAGIHSSMPIGAHADYLARFGAAPSWTGFDGIAQVAERWVGASCLSESTPQFGWRPPEGMICQKALFNVRFEATFRPAHSENPTPASHTMVMWMREQKVIGVKLTPSN